MNDADTLGPEVVPLTDGLTIAGRRIDTLTLRPPTADDLIRFGMTRGRDRRRFIRITARLSGKAERVIKTLSPRDFQAVTNGVGRLLERCGVPIEADADP